MSMHGASLYTTFVELDLAKARPKPRIVRRRNDRPTPGDDTSVIRMPAPSNLTLREQRRLCLELQPLARTVQRGYDVQSVDGGRPQIVLGGRARRALRRTHRVVHRRTRLARLRGAIRRCTYAWSLNRGADLRWIGESICATPEMIRQEVAERRAARQRERAAAERWAELDRQQAGGAASKRSARDPWADWDVQQRSAEAEAAPFVDDDASADSVRASGDIQIGSYVRADGTSVSGHVRSNLN